LGRHVRGATLGLRAASLPTPRSSATRRRARPDPARGRRSALRRRSLPRRSARPHCPTVSEAAVRATETQARSQRWNLQRAVQDVDSQGALLHARVAAIDKSKAALALAGLIFWELRRCFARSCRAPVARGRNRRRRKATTRPDRNGTTASRRSRRIHGHPRRRNSPVACRLTQATSHEDVPDRRHRDREQECAIWYRHGLIAAREWRDLNLKKPRRIKASISRRMPGFRNPAKIRCKADPTKSPPVAGISSVATDRGFPLHGARSIE